MRKQTIYGGAYVTASLKTVNVTQISDFSQALIGAIRQYQAQDNFTPSQIITISESLLQHPNHPLLSRIHFFLSRQYNGEAFSLLSSLNEAQLDLLQELDGLLNMEPTNKAVLILRFNGQIKQLMQQKNFSSQEIEHLLLWGSDSHGKLIAVYNYEAYFKKWGFNRTQIIKLFSKYHIPSLAEDITYLPGLLEKLAIDQVCSLITTAGFKNFSIIVGYFNQLENFGITSYQLFKVANHVNGKKRLDHLKMNYLELINQESKMTGHADYLRASANQEIIATYSAINWNDPLEYRRNTVGGTNAVPSSSSLDEDLFDLEEFMENIEKFGLDPLEEAMIKHLGMNKPLILQTSLKNANTLFDHFSSTHNLFWQYEDFAYFACLPQFSILLESLQFLIAKGYSSSQLIRLHQGNKLMQMVHFHYPLAALGLDIEAMVVVICLCNNEENLQLVLWHYPIILQQIDNGALCDHFLHCSLTVPHGKELLVILSDFSFILKDVYKIDLWQLIAIAKSPEGDQKIISLLINYLDWSRVLQYPDIQIYRCLIETVNWRGAVADLTAICRQQSPNKEVLERKYYPFYEEKFRLLDERYEWFNALFSQPPCSLNSEPRSFDHFNPIKLNQSEQMSSSSEVNQELSSLGFFSSSLHNNAPQTMAQSFTAYEI